MNAAFCGVMRWSASGSRMAWLVIRHRLRLCLRGTARKQLDGQRLEYGAQIRQDTQLTQDDAALRVAIEPLELAAGELEHITARSIHTLAGRRQHAEGEMERPVVCTLQRELHDHNVTADVDV